MHFELVGEMTETEVIATSRSIREHAALIERFGGSRWRKLKGVCLVRLDNGKLRRAEIHWYEAHGVGRRKMKIKRFLETLS